MTNKFLVSPRQGLVFVLFAGILWSSIGLGVRLMEEASVWQILFYRSFSLSVFLFLIIILLYKENPFKLITHSLYPCIFGGLSLFLAYSCGIYSIQLTSVANAMLLFASAPFITAILSWVILKERVRIVTWIAIVFATLGIFIMVSGETSYGNMKGNILALMSAVGFSFFTVALRWGKSGNMLPSVFLSGIFGVVITFFICWTMNLTFILSLNDLSVSLSMGIFQVGAGLVFYTLGSKTLTGAELTLLSMSEPLLGPLWVWLFLGETFQISTLYGGVILLTAIMGNAYYTINRNSYQNK